MGKEPGTGALDLKRKEETPPVHSTQQATLFYRKF